MIFLHADEAGLKLNVLPAMGPDGQGTPNFDSPCGEGVRFDPVGNVHAYRLRRLSLRMRTGWTVTTFAGPRSCTDGMHPTKPRSCLLFEGSKDG